MNTDFKRHVVSKIVACPALTKLENYGDRDAHMVDRIMAGFSIVETGHIQAMSDPVAIEEVIRTAFRLSDGGRLIDIWKEAFMKFKPDNVRAISKAILEGIDYLTPQMPFIHFLGTDHYLGSYDKDIPDDANAQIHFITHWLTSEPKKNNRFKAIQIKSLIHRSKHQEALAKVFIASKNWPGFLNADTDSRQRGIGLAGAIDTLIEHPTGFDKTQYAVETGIIIGENMKPSAEIKEPPEVTQESVKLNLKDDLPDYGALMQFLIKKYGAEESSPSEMTGEFDRLRKQVLSDMKHLHAQIAHEFNSFSILQKPERTNQNLTTLLRSIAQCQPEIKINLDEALSPIDPEEQVDVIRQRVLKKLNSQQHYSESKKEDKEIVISGPAGHPLLDELSKLFPQARLVTEPRAETVGDTIETHRFPSDSGVHEMTYSPSRKEMQIGGTPVVSLNPITHCHLYDVSRETALFIFESYKKAIKTGTLIAWKNWVIATFK